MQSSAVNAVSGLTWPGATTIPASPVKIDQRHHARLQQREKVADRRDAGMRRSEAHAVAVVHQLIFGSSL